MNAASYLLIISLLLPSFAYAYSYEEAVILAQEEKDQYDAALAEAKANAEALEAKEAALQDKIDAFYAFDDFATVLKYSGEDTTGDILLNDAGYFINTASLLSSTISKYGSFSLEGNGQYHYRLNQSATEVKALTLGDAVVDVFNYQILAIIEGKMYSRQATIYISILGQISGTSTSIYALDDLYNILKGAESDSVSGDVSKNDLGFVTGGFSLTSIPTSSTGALEFTSTGAFTYTLFPDGDIINLGNNEKITESYTYQILGKNDITASATLFINVLGKTFDANCYALDDAISLTATDLLPATGDLEENDNCGAEKSNYTFTSSVTGAYGSVSFPSNSNQGDFAYLIYRDEAGNAISDVVERLAVNETLTESFNYQVISDTGAKATATLKVTIFGGNGTSAENLEIEKNDSSSTANNLSAEQKITGHLYTGMDQDWYLLKSTGQEIITVNATSIAKGQVVYIFDKALLDSAGTEDDTIAGVPATSGNHLYLNYQNNTFNNSVVTSPPTIAPGDELIGVINPCIPGFPNSFTFETVSAKNYLVAVSSSLRATGTVDGAGICEPRLDPLNAPLRFIIGGDIDVEPNIDSKYSFSVSSTGTNPLSLLGTRSSTYTYTPSTRSADSSTSELFIPEIRVLDKLYSMNLIYTMVDEKMAFTVKSFDLLPIELVSSYDQASYNPVNMRVLIPKLEIVGSEIYYTIEMQATIASDGKVTYFDIIGITEIK